MSAYREPDGRDEVIRDGYVRDQCLVAATLRFEAQRFEDDAGWLDGNACLHAAWCAAGCWAMAVASMLRALSVSDGDPLPGWPDDVRREASQRTWLTDQRHTPEYRARLSVRPPPRRL